MKMRTTFAPLSAAACALALAAAPAAAQTDPGWVDIASWDTKHLYDGWSADELLDEEVYGSGGEVIGEVEDFIVGPEGNIKKVVVEGGGFLDIGDSHIAVPWDEIKRTGASSITVPVREGNLDNYGLFQNMDDTATKPQNFRVRELIGDYVMLQGDVGYGYVDDVIFSQTGKIEAVITEPAYGYGYRPGRFAVPYHGAAYDPYQPYYRTPYTRDQLTELRPFNYGELD